MKANSKTIHIDKELYARFFSIVSNAAEHKKTNVTNEVEHALKFFISNNILPSDFDSTDIDSKFDSINTKLDNLMNRQFGFLTTHEKLVLSNNRETLNITEKYFKTIADLFIRNDNVHSVLHKMISTILQVNLEKETFDKIKSLSDEQMKKALS